MKDKYTFTHISTNDNDFKQILKKYQSFLNNYKTYEETLSNKNAGTNNKSNKASSYKNSLAKIFVNYARIYGKIPEDPSSNETIENMKKLQSMTSFVTINRQTGRFYNAALEGYFNFVSLRDPLIIKRANKKFVSKRSIQSGRILPIYKSKKEQTISYYYPRDQRFSLIAMENNNWHCFFSKKHKLFKKDDGTPYLEAHHIIPMKYYGDFNVSIDQPCNIVPLCPNCHRKIHHARKRDRNKMIKFLYNCRVNDLKKNGINITLNKLLSYYDK
ncbi:HNH endonuclease [Limosilactobacillus fermentum]|uniref:HNH endonuclease n=1 Tax=Limosilactobacillus fermentum TaxID=1613 RepID=UPI002F26824A